MQPHQTYAKDLTDSSDRVIREGKAWVDYEPKALDHDIASSAHASAAESLKRQRALMADFLEQLKRFKK